jgi:hypothetical protein
LTGGLGRIIAKRSVSLSKTYPVIGIFLGLFAVFISNLSGLVGKLSTTGIPVGATGTNGLNLALTLPLLSIALQALATIIFATPVLLLYVYDKNNGTLEYFLSLGMNQGDVYKQYLKAALILSSALLGFEVIADVVAGLLAGTSGLMLLEVAGTVVAIALPAVSFGTLVMMSFSSLQKQRVGSNQPLGMVLGVFIVMPAYLASVVVPSLAFEFDLALAGLILFLSLLMYVASSRLISREKLLP